MEKESTEIVLGLGCGDLVRKAVMTKKESFSVTIPDDEPIVGIGIVTSPYEHHVYNDDGPNRVTVYQDFRGLEVYCKNEKGENYTVGRVPDTSSDPNASVKDKAMFSKGEYLTSFNVWMNVSGIVHQLHRIEVKTNLNSFGPYGTTGLKANIRFLNKNFSCDISEIMKLLSIDQGYFHVTTSFNCCCSCGGNCTYGQSDVMTLTDIRVTSFKAETEEKKTKKPKKEKKKN